MDIDTLSKLVESVDQEYTLAVSFHETWTPMAINESLHKRMGASYSTQAFLVIRVALRREMIMALMRIWDRNSKTHSLHNIFAELNNPQIWNQLLTKRAHVASGKPDLISSHLVGQRHEVCTLYDRYKKGGEQYESLNTVLKLRHTKLAHTQAPSRETASPTLLDGIDTIYEDTGIIVSKLMGLVCGVAIDYRDTKGIYAYYAKLFWDNARGEKTEGHPSFRPPPASA